MRTSYDPEADAHYVRFVEASIVESEEVADGVMLDFDAEDRIVAIELLDASKHIAAGAEFPTQRSEPGAIGPITTFSLQLPAAVLLPRAAFHLH